MKCLILNKNFLLNFTHITSRHYLSCFWLSSCEHHAVWKEAHALRSLRRPHWCLLWWWGKVSNIFCNHSKLIHLISDLTNGQFLDACNPLYGLSQVYCDLWEWWWCPHMGKSRWRWSQVYKCRGEGLFCSLEGKLTFVLVCSFTVYYKSIITLLMLQRLFS